MKEFHSQLSDNEFLEKLNNHTLNSKYFTHEAHLRLAWLNIKNLGLEKAIKITQETLLSYVKSLGAEEKYNTTLTVAAIKAVYHFMLKSEAITFEELIKTSPRLKTGFKGLMRTHYSFNILNSEQAKKEFLQPDLCAFD